MNVDPSTKSVMDPRSVLRNKKSCATNGRRTDAEEELVGEPQMSVWERHAAARRAASE
jgi:hypothetical protein